MTNNINGYIGYYNRLTSGQWSLSNNNLYNINSENIGINTNNPQYQLDVYGSIRVGDGNKTQYKLKIKTGVAVYALKYNKITNILFIGGEFTEVDRETYSNGILTTTITYIVNNLVAFNLNDGFVNTFGTSPDQIGLNGICHAIAINSIGDVYVGGSFTTVQGLSHNRIAKWNGTSWDALTSGLNNNTCYSIAIDTNEDVYVGGDFTNAGGVTNTSRIAKWLGSSWVAIGDGISNNTCYAITIGSENDLYVGGNFTNLGTANYIAKWTPGSPGSWTSLGNYQNSPNQTCYTLLYVSNILYAGGSFQTSQTGSPQYYIVSWNGSTWNNLGTGLNQECRALSTDGTNIYVGGRFTRSGPLPYSNRIAKWIPYANTWSGVNLGIDNNYCYALEYFNNNVYIGGNFTNAGNVTNANYIAQWSGSWDNVSSSIIQNNTLLVTKSNIDIGNTLFVKNERLGINNTNPNYALDINGYIKHNIIAFTVYEPNGKYTLNGINFLKAKNTAFITNNFIYSSISGLFTAPISGYYYFSANGTTGDGTGSIIIYKSDGTIIGPVISTSPSFFALSTSGVTFLNSGDMVGVQLLPDGPSFSFSGYLISAG